MKCSLAALNHRIYLDGHINREAAGLRGFLLANEQGEMDTYVSVM
ncbi:hypothetical protein ACM7Q1_17915 [Paenibacillus illinoisensis]